MVMMNTLPFSLPSPIRRMKGCGFADYTITRRLPKILDQAKMFSHKERAELEQWDALMRDIIEGNAIMTSGLARPTSFWDEYINALEGRSWDELPFFDLEFLFYHGLNSLAGFYSLGVDVFSHIRTHALTESLGEFDMALNRLEANCATDRLKNLIRSATWGNESDYSQIYARGKANAPSNSFLVDQTPELAVALAEALGPGRVEIILDNAGLELLWDLALVDAILQMSAMSVVLRVKPWPMFVSDALSVDVDATILAMCLRPYSTPTYLAGIRLHEAMLNRRLIVKDDTEWGEPRHFSNLNQELTNILRTSTLVISKGDLNYRRFVEDREWLPDTSIELATRGVEFSAFALRVLKSDAISGVPSDLVDRLSVLEPDWRFNGKNAVVQRLGKRTVSLINK